MTSFDLFADPTLSRRLNQSCSEVSFNLIHSMMQSATSVYSVLLICAMYICVHGQVSCKPASHVKGVGEGGQGITHTQGPHHGRGAAGAV